MKRTLYVLVLLNLILTVSLLGQIIKVDDYGAIGDGVTDDKAAIQNALDVLKSNGGELQFTSGKTYIISPTGSGEGESGLKLYHFSADKNYLITTTGNEKATIKIADGTSIIYGTWGMYLSDSKNITISNLHMDGNRNTRDPLVQVAGTYLIQIFDNCNGLRLNDLILENSVIDNIYIASTDKNDTTKFLSNFEMHNCILRNGWRNNMSVIRGKNFKIIGCEFDNAHGLGDPEAGIDFEPNGGGEYGYKDILVEGCTFKNNRRFGITLTVHDDIDIEGRVTIRNNYFENNGIYLLSSDNIIANNIFRKVDHKPQVNITGLKKDGIIVFTPWNEVCSNNKIYNNYFYDNPLPEGQHLIGLDGEGIGNSVYGNYSHNNNIDGFVLNSATHPDAQSIHNNTDLIRKEVGYWNMDSDSISGTSIFDLSDFKQTGELHNNPILVNGWYYEALDFSSDNKNIAIPIEKGLNIEVHLTVSVWINWQGANSESEQVVVGKDGDWRFGVDNAGKVGFYAPKTNDNSYTGGWIKSNTSIISGEWTHVAITYNGMATTIYVNGVNSGTKECLGNLDTNSIQISIASLIDNTNSFNGSIDEVKIFNYALASQEIDSLFNIPSKQHNNIVGQWDFNNSDDLTKATIGADLISFGSPTAILGPTDSNGAALLENGDYFSAVTTAIAHSGTGNKINTYTLLMDIKINEFVNGGFASLIQTGMSNTSDGDLFVRANGEIGNSSIGYSEAIFNTATWYRMILVVEEIAADNVRIDIYLNGSLAYNGTPQSVDNRLSLEDNVLLFCDDGSEEEPTAVSQMVLYDYALSDEEISALGDASVEILPVELTSFTAAVSDDVVILNWKTATEVNNYGFEVESSNDKLSWSKIGFISGHGNSNSPNSYIFTAVDVAKYYRLKQLDVDGGFEYSEIVEVGINLVYQLLQNYPNPFNPRTTISFTLAKEGMTKLSVFNILGKEVKILLNEHMQAGSYSTPFNGSNLSSGIYFYKLQCNNQIKLKKMLLVK